MSFIGTAVAQVVTANPVGVVAFVASGTADPIAVLLNYGVAGIMLALFSTGQIRTKSEVSGLQAQLADQSRLIEAMRVQLTGSTLPALARSTQVLEALPESEQALISELRRTVARLEAIQP